MSHPPKLYLTGYRDSDCCLFCKHAIIGYSSDPFCNIDNTHKFAEKAQKTGDEDYWWEWYRDHRVFDYEICDGYEKKKEE